MDKAYKILDILEFYNIIKFISNGLYHKDLSEKQVNTAKATMYKNISEYFKSATKNDITRDFQSFFARSEVDKLEELDKKISEEELDIFLNSEDHDFITYMEDYLECFGKYKLYEKITESDFYQILQAVTIPIHLLLKTRHFIESYPHTMKNIFLKDSSNFQLVLSNYFKDDYFGSTQQYYIPKEISKEEMYILAERYIESESASLEDIRTIEQGIQGISELNIDSRLKLKAKKKKQQIEEEIFQNKDGIYLNSERGEKISIHTNVDDYEADTARLKSLINLDWFKKNNKPEDLLESLMYLDHFFTSNWILNLCSFPNLESSTLTRFFSGTKTQKHYEISLLHPAKECLILNSFNVFQQVLSKEFSTRIEELILYFFNEYSEENFQLTWVNFDFADKNEKFNIQTKNAFTVEEHIRTQWKLLVEEGRIDSELFELESSPPIDKMKSLLDKKYIYINKENANTQSILGLLFSDQSGLTYINEKLKADNFAQLLFMNQLRKDDFHETKFLAIDFLTKQRIISIDEHGFITLTTEQAQRIAILCVIYKYGVVHYYHCLDHKIYTDKQLAILQQEIDIMIAEGFLISENTLFSKPESDYLNYVLNDSKFDNALGLRNKYLHGSVTREKHEDYLRILSILVVYVIKINEELNLK